ncbi:MAG: transporter substrate-binding domain-containing protein [Alphaproteobacteria bacterium]|nr:transporter substrate-binding domain-containing protein [Alphaproteobacteria bacterium]
MFRSIAFLAALLLPGLAFGGTLAEIKGRGALRVGLTGDYVPFSGRAADGGFFGADVEMAKSLAARLGVKVEFVATEWRRIADDLVADKYDIAMGGVSVTKDRAEKGHFSRSIMTDGKRPIVRCTDKDKYRDLAAIDRPEVRVVVNPGGTNQRFVNENLKATTPRVHPDNTTIFKEVAENRADIFISDGIEVELQSRRFPGVLCPAAVPAPFNSFEKAYLMTKDDALRAEVDRWLEGALTGGVWAKALEANLK